MCVCVCVRKGKKKQYGINVYLLNSVVLYCPRPPTSGNMVLVIVSRNPSDPASSDSLSSHRLGSSRNLSIGFPVKRSSGG